MCHLRSYKSWSSKGPYLRLSPPARYHNALLASTVLKPPREHGALGRATPNRLAPAPILTRQRYTVSTIFVDHFSRLSYVHLQRSTSADDTLQAKRPFEASAKTQGVVVKHYHADDGRFIQMASFCDHFKNGNNQCLSQDSKPTSITQRLLLRHGIRCRAANFSSIWLFTLSCSIDIQQDRKGYKLWKERARASEGASISLGEDRSEPQTSTIDSAQRQAECQASFLQVFVH
jgi:hypothetical protein